MILRLTPESAQAGTILYAPIAEEKDSPFVQPDSSAHAGVPAHAVA
jgi:hypothetical protein